MTVYDVFLLIGRVIAILAVLCLGAWSMMLTGGITGIGWAATAAVLIWIF